MKAAQINRYGGSDAVEINRNTASPVVSQGKLIVEVYAAGVNPVDWKIREGYMQQMRSPSLPITLGGDFSGLVMEIGEGVSGFKKGDEVYGQAIALGGGSGSFAEFALVNAKNIAYKPRSVNHLEAAALPLPGVSAYQALVDHIGLSRDKRILVHGGAGGIGTFAIQIAKHLGAYAAATASTDSIKYVKDLGADEIIDYRRQSFQDLLHDYDAVFDTVGGDTYVNSFKVLKKGGIIVSMLEQPHADLMEKYGVTTIAQFTQVTSGRLAKLAELVDHGAVKVYMDRIFPLEEAGEALSYLQKGHPRGKVVLEIK